VHWFINFCIIPCVMHLPEEGHKWSKHVGGILCLSYEILLYVCMHLLFLLPYLIVITFKSWCLHLDMQL